jgi:hypothetical protein
MRTPHQALAVSMLTKTNVPGTCQFVTRGWLDAPSAGDFDADGAADAEDGWKKEPASAKRFDRNPPAGYPVAYLGGSKDNGHRAISAGRINGVTHIRSTDAGGPGRVATVPLDFPEKNWGLKYAGWSKTMDGVPIPPDKHTRGFHIDRSLRQLIRAERHAPQHSLRHSKIQRAIAVLKSLPQRLKK